MVLKKDRSFTFTIDKKQNKTQTVWWKLVKPLLVNCQKLLSPEIDTYRFATIAGGADAGNIVTAAVTKDNAYEAVLDGQIKLTEAFVPTAGRVLHVSSKFYKLIKLDPAFVKQSDLGQQITINGQVGMIDACQLFLPPRAPSTRCWVHYRSPSSYYITS